MPPKLPKKFEGEGNPSETVSSIILGEPVMTVAPATDTTVILSEDVRSVLKKLLDRDRTARLVHGGLKSLLTLSDDDEVILLNFLRRI